MGRLKKPPALPFGALLSPALGQRHRLRPTVGHGRSTGGRTRQCSGGGHCPRFLPLGRCLHGGVVVVIIVYLEWGHFRHLILARSGRSQTTYTSTQIKRRNWVMEGPKSPHFRLMLSLELGAPRLAFGFALAATTSVDSPQREFFKIVPVRCDGGKANCCSF